ncbi:hypothetical protein KR51_00002780 [Rubidibacter lacunae KORDI 51-2]|uniref:Copper-binding protein MbnP-like domain-containing protein n=1 Tax=Rubidibacter lacunae KORDI 51-2 TaxID=582515 RepID=U5DTG0_9CHRO|nr:MbnP family copper-binding protein [Rubidibacter lacunae]ERN42970.1 hypothetical protein KR51_00002780 [Rubidibacter lacunae KORDI 51-2]
MGWLDRRTVRAFVGAAIASVLAGVTATQAQEAERQPVQVVFAARVGDRVFACGETYDLGRTAMLLQPADFRFYVSKVALIDTNGRAVPVVLEQDGKWQHKDLTLLDFEDRTGACDNGTVETRDRVVGTVPAGDYRGVRFLLGVPFDLNHADAVTAPSPLNLTSMWWNWQGGYKFLRLDLSAPMAAAVDGTMPDMPNMSDVSNHGGHGGHDGRESKQHGSSHGHHGDNHVSHSSGYSLHLGSSGCEVPVGARQPTHCRYPNVVEVTLEGYEPGRSVVVADLGALVANSDLSSNAPDTPLGCMSGPDDADCQPVFNQLGLPFAAANAGDDEVQHFFRLE